MSENPVHQASPMPKKSKTSSHTAKLRATMFEGMTSTVKFKSMSGNKVWNEKSAQEIVPFLRVQFNDPSATLTGTTDTGVDLAALHAATPSANQLVTLLNCLNVAIGKYLKGAQTLNYVDLWMVGFKLNFLTYDQKATILTDKWALSFD